MMGVIYLRLSVPNKIDSLLHGSCRNPHHASEDALISADNYQGTQRNQGEIGAQLLLLSGDQVYADDVAGADVTSDLSADRYSRYIQRNITECRFTR